MKIHFTKLAPTVLFFLLSGSVFSSEIDKNIKLSEIQAFKVNGFPGLGGFNDIFADSHRIEFSKEFYIPEGLSVQFIHGKKCSVTGSYEKISLFYFIPIWTPGPNTIESGDSWAAFKVTVDGRWGVVSNAQVIFFNYYNLPHAVVLNCSNDLTLNQVEDDLKDEKGIPAFQFYFD